MSVDMSHALRHDECLANPSALAGARWGGASVDMSHALRHDECLANPSALAGARWGEASVTPSPSIPLPRGEREEKPLSPRGRGVGERGGGEGEAQRHTFAPAATASKKHKPLHQRPSQPQNPLNAAPVLVSEQIS